MIEERIIEWLDLGDSVQKIDLYERPKLIKYFQYHHLLLKHGINSESLDIVFQLMFFLQLISLSMINIDKKDDLILEVFKYFEKVILPYKYISDTNNLYTIFSIVIWSIIFVHFILTLISVIFLYRKNTLKILFYFLSFLNCLIFYYLICPILHITLNGTKCINNKHEFLGKECYSNSLHLAILILNFFFGLYSLFIMETFALYNNRIGSLHEMTNRTRIRINCDYDIHSSNFKIIILIIEYFYTKYYNDSDIFKYVYQSLFFIFCLIISIYALKQVYFYNQNINHLIHFGWFFVTWFALCMLLKSIFEINDSTIFIIMGWIIITIVLIYYNKFSYYKRITQINLFTDQSLVYIQKFISTLLLLYQSTKKMEKVLLLGVIKKLENYIESNPELNNVYKSLLNDSYMRKKYSRVNQLSILSLIYNIYNFYFEKSDIKNDIILCMCYFLINHKQNPTYAGYLLSKLKVNNHSQLYQKFVLIEDIKEYLMNKLIEKNYGKSINHIQVGSVILYYQYMDIFKIKIYDGISHQIEYFDILRNNITNGKVAKNFLKTGEEILSLKDEINQIWKQIVDLNPFCNESQNDYMLYLKTILQDDALAKNEEKKYNLLQTSKIAEKNNFYYSMFKHDINSVLLIDGYSNNGRIIYATPNFPILYQFNWKEIVNSQIEEFIPNIIQSFHKDLIENTLKYSNVSRVFHKSIDSFLRGKNNLLYNIQLYVKPIPNLTYGLIYIALITKIKEHEFIITLDSNFKIDGFTEMNKGNSFTLNNTQNSSFNLTSNFINKHIGIIIPEILLQLHYKDNTFYINNNIDIKGNLYSIGNAKDLEPKLNILLDIIKKKGFLNIDEDSDKENKNLFEYNNFIKSILSKHSKSHSIFFKVTTIKFLGGKYHYHRLYITNDTLSLNENFLSSPTFYQSLTEEQENKKKLNEKHINLADKVDLDLVIKPELKISKKDVVPKDQKRSIKLRLPVDKDNKKGPGENNMNPNTDNKDNIKHMIDNKLNRENSLKAQTHFDSGGFNKLKNGIVNKKDSIQITVMKWVSLFYVIIIVLLVYYEYDYSNNLYVNLVEYLKENLYFIHSKIISSCLYINSINLKWLKYNYIDEDSCLNNCSLFSISLLEDCIKNLKQRKDSLSSFDPDFQHIILRRRGIKVKIFNTNETANLTLDVNDNLNFIISKGIKLCGNFKNYLDYYGNDKINMENLISQTLEYFQWGVSRYKGQEKLDKVSSKFGNNNLSIILGTILCVILLTIFTYFVFKFNQLEIFFLDKLINFNTPNFEMYLKNLEELKKKLKNYKNEEEENLDEMELEMGGKSGDDSKQKNSKKQDDKNKKINRTKEGDEKKKRLSQKKGTKQNKVQLQRIRKKKFMAYYFYKENILFGIKIFLILICYVSYFVVSLLVYKMYYNNYLDFDTITNNMEELYYESFRTFLQFKSELAEYQTDNFNYKMNLPKGNDIQIPNFGNILNELNQNKIYSQKNKDIITQLYNGDMCSLLFNTTENYDYCKEFLSSILLKGMEQAIIQMGVLINSVIDEISLVDSEEEFKELVRGNTTNYKKYELFIVYFLYHAYLKNDEIFNGLRSDQTNYYLNLTLEIIIIYYIGYFILFIIMCYFIFRYKYIYTSLFNFCAILSLKAISEDEFFYQKILELEKQLYN